MNVIDILKAKKISRTETREKILAAMLYKGPLSQKEIIQLVNFDLNRITLYRTLREFIKKKIIVQIQDDKGEEKFFINYSNNYSRMTRNCVHPGKLGELLLCRRGLIIKKASN